MTPIAIVLIVISVFAHAFWNLLGKRRNPSASFFFVATVAAAICLSPLLVYYRQALTFIPGSVWMLVVATGVCEAVYYAGLGGAYRRGDMSLAYPLARAVPVLLVAGLSLALGRGSQISRLGLVGITMVGAGCLILPLPGFGKFRLEHYANACCLLALLAALGTSGYTLIDDEALRQLRAQPQIALNNTHVTLLFMALQAVSTTFVLAAYTLLYAPERRHLKEIWKTGKLYAAVTGLIITATYGLVLASMAYVDNVSYVAAFRQLSIPLGALLGIVVQKEPPYIPKLIGTGIVFVGLILVGLT
jgi:drug/metabolite transporter (DMT)-like permease